MAEEYLDVVDETDRVVGRRMLDDCLRLGLLHRAVVVFLSDAAGRVFIQKRSSAKRWYPGYWSASCTGHVSSGESYVEGARRELREELGVVCELALVGKFLTPKWAYGGVTEWEFDAVFEGKVSGASFTLNEEVEEGRWVSRDWLKRMVEDGSDFTPDTIMALAEFERRAEDH